MNMWRRAVMKLQLEQQRHDTTEYEGMKTMIAKLPTFLYLYDRAFPRNIWIQPAWPVHKTELDLKWTNSTWKNVPVIIAFRIDTPGPLEFSFQRPNSLMEPCSPGGSGSPMTPMRSFRSGKSYLAEMCSARVPP